jgi:hypothetical protein
MGLVRLRDKALLNSSLITTHTLSSYK